MLKHSYFRTKVAILVKDYLPLPPTPINKAFPLGYLKILQIFERCFTASKKNTKFIFLGLEAL